ncbi:MAG: hypothetical protein ACOX6T_02255 [Myxococcales bacterium]|jgi:hypothetical protein
MLPITRVVLFKHGVGFFQRTGEVDGRELIELSFKATQMNDVLKSLTALDYDGGTFAALSYDSEEPIERKLAELNIEIPEKGAVSAFLDRLKGARVSLPRGAQKLQGAVVGIEEVRRQHGEAIVTEPHLAVFADEGRLVRVPLLEVEQLEFLDETVRRDLRTLLDVLFSGLRKDRKRLSIQAVGEGRRRVSLSYVVEAPVWKTSYRIVLPEKKDDNPLLQGWALVDNTTEDDWKGVSLSLVAGLPISFVHDLYTPRYRKRPIVEVQEEAGVAPPIVEAGVMPPEAPAYDMELAEAPRAPMRARAAAMMAPSAPPPPAPMGAAARAAVQVQTRTQEVGDLFAYEITQPVDVGRGRSALVPILQADVDVERVALYNPSVREKNPMTAFRLKNSTGLTLEGGPVTVFEGDSYVGEAMLDTLRAGEERITPYSVELGVTVKHDAFERREDYTRATRHGQYIHKHYRRLLITRYDLSSRLDRELIAYLDHRFSYPVREETPEPVEITESFWRFRLALEPKKTTHFEVKEVAEQSEAIYVPNIALHEVKRLFTEKLIPESARKRLEEIARHAETISRLQQRISEDEQAIGRLEQGQARVRENLKALGASSEEARLRSKYVAKLSDEEEQIERLRAEIAELKEQIETEKEAVAKLIDKLQIPA